MKQRIYIIAGPTASGKTAAAIGVAKRMNAEIVSADSIQIYRGLDIGSAKPSVQEQCGVPHHLIDCVDIEDRSFNVAMFRERASEKIREIASRGKNALVVGGTGLYINALTYPLNFSSAEPNIERREELKNGWKTASGKPVENRELWERLLELQRVHKLDWRKVKGHADNPYNNRCDKLATTAAANLKKQN